MEWCGAGTFVRSLAGHDKDRIYVIVREEERDVFLADGCLRKVERPKRKNRKHVQPVKRKLSGGGDWSDEAVKRAIQSYIKESRNVQE